jgi:PleD family two-component response regulator
MEHAIILAERIRKSVESSRYEFDSGNKSAAVTLTLGVSLISSGDTIESMIKRGDIALYCGKQKCRNCVMLFSEAKQTIEL